MTPTTLRSIMENQNLSNLDLATIVGVTDRQVRSWLTGAYPIPQLVSIFLEALEEGLISQEWLLPRVEEELRVLVD
jgi:DNA-binding transcriptional regulator YiaG